MPEQSKLKAGTQLTERKTNWEGLILPSLSLGAWVPSLVKETLGLLSLWGLFRPKLH